MRRWLVAGVVGAFVALALPALARADGEDIGLAWGDCVVAPALDADRDGVDDACELAVAARFQPEFVFGLEETAPARNPFWASRPDGYHTLRIFYALSYYRDAGDPTFGGLSSHDGDSEFIVLRVRNTSGHVWQLDEAYFSAHYETGCDAGGWFAFHELEYVASYRGQPVVYAAEGKHANYRNLADCDAGGCLQDHCSDFFREDVGIGPARDLGLRGPTQELVDEVVELGRSEWYWTDVVFCGWTRLTGDAREGCVPVANSYARQLDTFEMAYGPVGSTGVCGSCSDALDCADGGACIPVEGQPVCTRDCSAAPCPTGTSCVHLGNGDLQCVPEVGCACVLACAGKACGDDGCGGTCGSCAPGEACTPAGQCAPAGAVCTACPLGNECAPGLACGASAAGAARYCLAPCTAGACEAGFECRSEPEGALCAPALVSGCQGGDVWSFDGCGSPLALVTACVAGSCQNGACACSCDAKGCGEGDGCGAPCDGACADVAADGGCACRLPAAPSRDVPWLLGVVAAALWARRHGGTAASSSRCARAGGRAAGRARSSEVER
ncbi:MAG: Vps62-related protein [Myxococcales bacterium]|nr:Vps62-related protein [Myxococcales bacterium]